MFTQTPQEGPARGEWEEWVWPGLRFRETDGVQRGLSGGRKQPDIHRASYLLAVGPHACHRTATG